MEDKIKDARKEIDQLDQELLKLLYSQPILNTNQIAERLQITQPSASTLVKQFAKIEILREITGFKRNRLFKFSEYLKLFDKSTMRHA